MERAQLLADLVQGYGESEMARLCSQLGLQRGDLGGSTHRDRIERLVNEAEARGVIGQLIEIMVADRPELARGYLNKEVLGWIDRVLPEELTVVEELPTLKWPDPQFRRSSSEVTKATIHGGVAPLETPTMTWPEDRQWTGTGDLAADMDAYTSQFVDREVERTQLATYLMGAESCAVVGVPYIGKSSLLNFLCEHETFPPELKMLFAYLDLRLEQFRSVAGLHNGALSGWYARLIDAPPPVAPTLEDFARQLRTLHDAGFRPILVLDGFEHLMRQPAIFNDELFATWTEMAQEGRLTFVVALERPLAESMKCYGLASRFAQAVHQVELGLLDDLAARRLLIKTPSADDVQLPSMWVEPLLALCGRHPYYLRLAAIAAREELLAGNADLAVVSQKLRHLATSSWDRLWGALSARQHSLLTTPFAEDPPLVIARQYQGLANQGLVVEENGGFQPFSQLFAEWLLDRS